MVHIHGVIVTLGNSNKMSIAIPVEDHALLAEDILAEDLSSSLSKSFLNKTRNSAAYHGFNDHSHPFIDYMLHKKHLINKNDD